MPNVEHNPYQPPQARIAGEHREWAAEELTVGGTLGRSFSLFISHIGIIALVLLVIYGPVEIIKNYALYSVVLDEWGVTRLDTIIGGLVNALVAPAIIYAIVENHRTGKPVGLGAALGYGVKRWAELLGANIVAGILVGLATLLLLIPGIIVAIWYALIDEVVSLEHRGAESPLIRSKALSRGHGWQMFGIFGLTFVLLGGFAFAAGLGYEYAHHFLVGAAIDIAIDLVYGFLIVVGLVVYVNARYGDEGGTTWMERVRWLPRPAESETPETNEPEPA